ncbi:winged helix-turn-helix transcriptional regulator [Cohnella silvisoli]|uniref:Helix-turn-helix domain-containing protein n=1 Tax=Cohnella silvisoli TaxID=2873699 RepID=A0ABV1L0G0_9BACL|nr:helix-turn-helix domain-containing protein [Cohnella silvisoli]MCD9025072.1 helix-turn-helix transcriptional regulator [Cohnella silvisoli]
MISPGCPGAIEPILTILDGKWNLLLLRELFNGTKRFGELRRSLHPISPKTLTDRLRMLEEQEIVTRTLYPGVPLHVEYELTERGQRLQPIFAAMWMWVQEYGACPQKETDDGGQDAEAVM